VKKKALVYTITNDGVMPLVKWQMGILLVLWQRQQATQKHIIIGAKTLTVRHLIGRW